MHCLFVCWHEPPGRDEYPPSRDEYPPGGATLFVFLFVVLMLFVLKVNVISGIDMCIPYWVPC